MTEIEQARQMLLEDPSMIPSAMKECATEFVGDFGRDYAPAKELPESPDSTIARR